MKKVLFVATVTRHINTFHIPYLKWFKEQGYQVHVASNGDEEIEYCDKHYNLPFERFPMKKNNIKTYQKLKEIIDSNQYQIIHCHTPVGGVLSRLAARRARKQGTKVIYTAHGFHFYKGAPFKNWLLYYPIEKLLSKYTDCLITITNEDYEFAKKHLKVEKIEHVYGVGMNTERLKKVDDLKIKEIVSKYDIKSNDTIFAYIAELNENKNQMLLINVIEKLKDEFENIKLLLIGDGSLKEKYQYEIEKKGLKQEIILLGKRNDISEILSITDIYLASSLREGLPVNIMEAMYKGLPIIATVNRGHRELIENNKNGFIVHNEDQLKEKIISLIQNKELRADMGRVAQEKVKKYEIDNILEKMKIVYDYQLEGRN